VADHDLVINCTADFSVTALFHQVAAATGAHILSAAVQNEGMTLRVDVLPPLEGDPLEDSARRISTNHELIYEAGCGSPISPTPPSAVLEVAAIAVRHAVGLLVGQPIHPAGEVRHICN